jgi:hypothetical protein
MRRLVLSMLSLVALAGCDHVCSHGVCDCLVDDHCCTRAPWVQYGPAPASFGAPVVHTDAPTKELPKGL